MRAQPAASHYIDGAYREDPAGATFQSLHPADGQPIAALHTATPAIVEDAVRAAREAFAQWACTPGAERGRILRRAADLIRMRNRELSVLESLDTGKPLQETLVADAASGADCLDFFAGLAAGIAGQHIDLGQAFAYTRREPLGVCVGIGAWNYPIQIACWKAAPALACGNVMIFKPSELTPLSALKLAEILTEAGVPPGVFNVIQGGAPVGEALVRHPGVAKVSLTGSVATGEKITAAAGIKPLTMELGGKSPLIVFEDADLDSAVAGAMLGNFYSSGQICSNGTRVFIHEAVEDAFLEKLLARTKALRLGDPLDESTQIGPLISAAQRDKVLAYIEIGKSEGATLLCGGGPARLQGFESGTFVEPTIFTGVTDTMRIAREEIFGPVMCVLRFADEAEVVERANGSPYGLAAGLFTHDLTRAHRVAARLEAGICWVNTYNITPVEIPFGGTRRSGFGRENGAAAIEHYTRLKSVYVAMEPVSAPY